MYPESLKYFILKQNYEGAIILIQIRRSLLNRDSLPVSNALTPPLILDKQ